MAKTIVFIADDLGVNKEVNQAITHAHRFGVLNGAALMMGQTGSEDAVARARECPGLEIGWHLHLLDSQPCGRESWPWGSSPVAAGFALGLSPKARRIARDEIRRQWDALQATGLDCRFVNTHHHLHVHPFVRATLLETLPRDFDGWLRWGRPRFFDGGASRSFHQTIYRMLQRPHVQDFGFPCSATLWGLDRTFRMNAAEVCTVLPSLGDGLHEFMFHPRAIDSDRDVDCLVELRSHLVNGL